MSSLLTFANEAIPLFYERIVALESNSIQLRILLLYFIQVLLNIRHKIEYKIKMDELGLERNHLDFFFKRLLLLDQTEYLCEKTNTLNSRQFTPS
jgi:hypothetical protein